MANPLCKGVAVGALEVPAGIVHVIERFHFLELTLLLSYCSHGCFHAVMVLYVIFQNEDLAFLALHSSVRASFGVVKKLGSSEILLALMRALVGSVNASRQMSRRFMVAHPLLDI